MVDNVNIILPLLKFESEDDFYYLQILQRKKENPQLGSNSRVIKNYYIRSQQHLLDRYDEIKELCRIFNARASIRLNKRSFEKTAYKAMVNTSNSMANKEFRYTGKAYDRACGQGHNASRSEKTWILDIDEVYSPELEKSLREYITGADPDAGEDKMICEIPSKSGTHIITKPFNLKDFREYFEGIEVHKDNPTNLFII